MVLFVANKNNFFPDFHRLDLETAFILSTYGVESGCF